jgi:hypothetical protein
MVRLAAEKRTQLVSIFKRPASVLSLLGGNDTAQESLADSPEAGIIPRSLAYLIEKSSNTSEVLKITASYYEIYNESVRDLLNDIDTPNLPVRQSKELGFYVEGLIKRQCKGLADLIELFELGVSKRCTSAHKLNEY